MAGEAAKAGFHKDTVYGGGGQWQPTFANVHASDEGSALRGVFPISLERPPVVRLVHCSH